MARVRDRVVPSERLPDLLVWIQFVRHQVRGRVNVGLDYLPEVGSTDMGWRDHTNAPTAFHQRDHGGLPPHEVRATPLLERAPARGADGLQFLCARLAAHIGLVYLDNAAERSEERRVGKECRSRWSPYH